MGAITDYFGGAPMRIFLVENSIEQRAEFTRTLDRSEELVLISVAGDADAAIKGLETIATDGVLISETLSDMPWQKLAERILDRHPKMRVYVHTDRATAQLIDQCRASRVRAPIKKGLPLADLEKALADVLEEEKRQILRATDASDSAGSFRSISPDRRAEYVIVGSSGYAGGAGKTTALINMAIALASDPSFPGQVAFLELEKGRGSILDLFDRNMPAQPGILEFRDWAGQNEIPWPTVAASLERAKNLAPLRRFHLATFFGSGSFANDDEVTEPLVTTLLNTLRKNFRVVFCDLPGDITPAGIAAMRGATSILWFSRLDWKDYRRHQDALSLLRNPRIGIDPARFLCVPSMVPTKMEIRVSKAQLQAAFRMPICPISIPYEQTIAMPTPGEFPAIAARDKPYMNAVLEVLRQVCPETPAIRQKRTRQPWFPFTKASTARR